MKRITYGVITHEGLPGEDNLGDDIQAIAAGKFLPRVDRILEREKLNTYTEEVFTILNGWFMHNPAAFPPSRQITPIIITSFHISPMAAQRMMTPETIRYLKKYQPVGCRDLYTQRLLEDHGIEAWFSGCVTLTLKKKDFEYPGLPRGKVILSDIFFRYKPHGGRKEISRYYFFQKWTKRRLIKKLLPGNIEKEALWLSKSPKAMQNG